MNPLRRMLFATAQLPATFEAKDKVYVDLDVCPKLSAAVAIDQANRRAYCMMQDRKCEMLQMRDTVGGRITCKAANPDEVVAPPGGRTASNLPGWERRTFRGRSTDEGGQTLEAFDWEDDKGRRWTIRQRKKIERYPAHKDFGREWWVVHMVDTRGRKGYMGQHGKTRYIDQARAFGSPQEASKWVKKRAKKKR